MKLNLIKRTRSLGPAVHSMEEGKLDVMKEFADLFDGELSALPGLQSIALKEGNEPLPRVFPTRRIPLRCRERVREKLMQMQRSGVIEKTNRPSKYVLPMVVVSKADGTFRICLDPRYINPYIQRRRFPMPVAQDLLMELKGAQVYTVVDGDAAF